MIVVSSVVGVSLLWRLWQASNSLPALSGFLVVGPLLAIGLYEKSRRLRTGEGVTLYSMLVAHSRSRGQLVFAGLLLCLLVMLWLRAAHLLYALFFARILLTPDQPIPFLEPRRESDDQTSVV